jgi:NAD-dependent SIR2 family protein deacetylase
MDVISSQRITIGRPTSSPSQFAAVQDELLNQVAETGSGRVLILVGAGLSKAVGLPSWNGLLEELGINGKPPPTEHELRRNRLGNELPEILTVKPKRLGLGPTHRLLAMSGVRGILTTNYDKVIEMAFTNAGLHDQDSTELHPGQSTGPRSVFQNRHSCSNSMETWTM